MAKLSREFLAKRRKRMVTALIVVGVLAAAASVFLFFTREKPPEKATPYTAEVSSSRPFSLNDPDAKSIFEDPAYLSLDRSLHMGNGYEEYTVSDSDSEFADENSDFFLEYFDALEHGASERYDAMFTDAYYEKYLAQSDFSEQRVYDIHITQLAGGESPTTSFFLVDYKIAKNNGSFRRDIASDASRPVVFELVRTDGGFKINDVHYVSGR